MNSSLNVAFRGVLAGIVLSSGANRIHAQAPPPPPPAQVPEKTPEKSRQRKKIHLRPNPLRPYRRE